MSEQKRKPTPLQLFIWAIPLIVSAVFTIFTLVIHRGAEVGFAALLTSFLYFVMRYGTFTQDSPPQ